MHNLTSHIIPCRPISSHITGQESQPHSKGTVGVAAVAAVAAAVAAVAAGRQ